MYWPLGQKVPECLIFEIQILPNHGSSESVKEDDNTSYEQHGLCPHLWTFLPPMWYRWLG